MYVFGTTKLVSQKQLQQTVDPNHPETRSDLVNQVCDKALKFVTIDPITNEFKTYAGY